MNLIYVYLQTLHSARMIDLFVSSLGENTPTTEQKIEPKKM
jgi:hypothetical protein